MVCPFGGNGVTVTAHSMIIMDTHYFRFLFDSDRFRLFGKWFSSLQDLFDTN